MTRANELIEQVMLGEDPISVVEQGEDELSSAPKSDKQIKRFASLRKRSNEVTNGEEV